MSLPEGIYDALVTRGLKSVLENHPELHTIFGKLDPEEEPHRYAAFVAKVLQQALRLEKDTASRLRLCNEILKRLGSLENAHHLEEHEISPGDDGLLLEITPQHYASPGIPRPETPISTSSLFTGSPADPQLVHELQQEMFSADSTDILVSFIKWSGVRLLMSSLEELTRRGSQLRIITTSYMGASDAEAIEWLARLPNTKIRVSYDTQRSRLHAKAYHFRRKTGFSTAYIGSANMSHAAMTSGLEWNLKVTAQDLPHILEKFTAEFDTYWHSPDFLPFDPDQPTILRQAIKTARARTSPTQVFFDIKPHAFQERILDALTAERELHNLNKNLIVAATGTGKTVVAAFDFKRFFEQRKREARLLFVAHKREILEQAAATFRSILRIPDFGELLVGPHQATRLDHLFCSVDMLRTRRLWEQVGKRFYDFIIIDEVHHGTATSYRPIFTEFEPEIRLGLTATPERMDGDNVAEDFGNRFAAEIRLPEALEEKLLCPFHYFGVADPVGLESDRFWRNGKYDIEALENVYTGAHALAFQRLDAIYSALTRFEPSLDRVRGVGFCVGVKHAEFMAKAFRNRGIPSAALIHETNDRERDRLLSELRTGEIQFIFTRDVLSEGFDLPDINTVLFLRPTESLTVFLQQLGRGLRHATDKDSLTVLDFVGQCHKKYRIERKLKALLPKQRFSIDREVEMDFPHLPSGCSIQLDRIARKHVLANIRNQLNNLKDQVIDRLESFESEARKDLTFGNFVKFHDYEPEALLSKGTWSEWKAWARKGSVPQDLHLKQLRKSLIRVAQTDGPQELQSLATVVQQLRNRQVDEALTTAGEAGMRIHYRLWGKPGAKSLKDSFARMASNPTVLSDLHEIIAWATDVSQVGILSPNLPFECPFELHARYSALDINASLGGATLKTPGQRGIGVLPFLDRSVYALLVTYQKTEDQFSPTTMYKDYPISRTLLHWESQSGTHQKSKSGKNLIEHAERGYTVLIFARDRKKRNNEAVPFTYLGPAVRVSHESERPIKFIWRLTHQMPADMFEQNRKGG